MWVKGRQNYNMVALHVLPLVAFSLTLNAVEGFAFSYAVTENIGECVRTCLALSSCLLIFWKESGLPSGSPKENCGPQAPTLSAPDLANLKNLDQRGVSVYMNSDFNSTSSPAPYVPKPGCATFIYISPGESTKFSTPDPFSHGRCSILIVSDENSQLRLTARFACNSQCACSDLLSLHNSLLSETQPQAVTACLDPGDNQTDLYVTSAKGGFLQLDLDRDAMSQASYEVEIESFSTAKKMPAFSRDDLVRDTNSGVQHPSCYRPVGYVPYLCPATVTGAWNTTSRDDFTTGTVIDSTVVALPTGTDSEMAAEMTATTATTTNSGSSRSSTNIGMDTTTEEYKSSTNNDEEINENDKDNASNESDDDDNNSNNYHSTTDKNDILSAEERISEGTTSTSLEPGIIAGIAVACLLSLLLVAVIIYFTFWRGKRNHVHPGLINESEHILTSSPPASTAVTSSPRRTTTTTTTAA